MRIIEKKEKWKATALLLALSLPMCALAQNGLFQRGVDDGGTDRNTGLFRNGEPTGFLSNQTFGNSIGGSDLTNQTFGAPMGSGMLVMLMAGTGYAALKTNNKKKNKKEKENQK